MNVPAKKLSVPLPSIGVECATPTCLRDKMTNCSSSDLELGHSDLVLNLLADEPADAKARTSSMTPAGSLGDLKKLMVTAAQRRVLREST